MFDAFQFLNHDPDNLVWQESNGSGCNLRLKLLIRIGKTELVRKVVYVGGTPHGMCSTQSKMSKKTKAVTNVD